MTQPPNSEIWQLQAQVDIQGLIKALSSPDASIRRRAAAALRTMGAQQALPALRVALAGESDEQARLALEAAVNALGETSAEAPPATVEATPPPLPVEKPLVERLIEKLKSPNNDEVITTARELGELGDRLAVAPLIIVFNNTTAPIQIRLAAAEALLKLESAPVEVALLANLRHKDWQIRRNGAAILGQLKASWAIQPLAKALSDPHPVVRRTARAALKYMATPEARRVLAQTGGENAPQAPMQPLAPGAKTPPPPTTPAGNVVKPVSMNQNSKSKMLDRLTPQSPPTPSGHTQALDPANAPLPPDKRIVAMAPTRPLDPQVLEALERQLQEEQQKKEKPDQKPE